MAYVSQERKAKLAPAIKAVLKKYKMKGTISVQNHSTLVVKIKSGAIEFLNFFNLKGREEWAWKNPTWKWEDRDYIDVNVYHIESCFSNNPKGLKFLQELKNAMMTGNHDRSDLMSDYFDVGWYIDIRIGDWKKPYVVTK
jgi:hypothetical protein